MTTFSHSWADNQLGETNVGHDELQQTFNSSVEWHCTDSSSTIVPLSWPFENGDIEKNFIEKN